MSQLYALARRVWKYRWIGLGVAWLVGVVGLVGSFLVPNRYESSARIYVDTQSILKPLMGGLAVQPNVEMQVTQLSKTLISRPNIEKLIRMADLDLKKQTKAQQEAQIEHLMKTLSIATTGRDNLYTLAYNNPNPEVAKKVVQSLVSIFVESSLGATRKDSASATTFINEQIKTYEAKLEEAEQRLKEFRLRNLELAQPDGKDATSRLAEMSQQLNRAKLELREAENARDAARAQLEGERGRGQDATAASLMQESSLSVATPEIDSRLDSLRRGLDGLLQRYTDQHPDVQTTRRLIRDLEDQKKREVAELRRQALANPATAGGAVGAVQQELSRLLASSEIQVAALKARVNEFQSRYSQAMEAMKTAPQVEAEAAQLNRDYEIHKKKYEELVARREAAAISGDLDVAAGVADFRLIDPPRVSPRPVAPNRFLLLGAALAAALGGGLFASFAASQLRPVFFEPGELRARTELPILGVVSRIISEAETRRVRLDRLRFLGGSAALLLMFGAAMLALVVISARQGG
ncbi:polysaccharide chain length determinant protein (PEP-CTERM system associated) [Inhella inkyongensis]|uniref:Polysaccharide chain length determinant protein (PEP-CTERM system associated) n=2 Tax=Inhella inkyongensis TaxID=392593 RepID=A0A840RYX5_9BURK|nr:polysaccharide chain length determinant protein (PEP-CTERM system associated) [Inhella inkyongensis]